LLQQLKLTIMKTLFILIAIFSFNSAIESNAQECNFTSQVKISLKEVSGDWLASVDSPITDDLNNIKIIIDKGCHTIYVVNTDLNINDQVIEIQNGETGVKKTFNYSAFFKENKNKDFDEHEGFFFLGDYYESIPASMPDADYNSGQEKTGFDFMENQYENLNKENEIIPLNPETGKVLSPNEFIFSGKVFEDINEEMIMSEI
jgi:hypothetical protein